MDMTRDEQLAQAERGLVGKLMRARKAEAEARQAASRGGHSWDAGEGPSLARWTDVVEEALGIIRAEQAVRQAATVGTIATFERELSAG